MVYRSYHDSWPLCYCFSSVTALCYPILISSSFLSVVCYWVCLFSFRYWDYLLCFTSVYFVTPTYMIPRNGSVPSTSLDDTPVLCVDLNSGSSAVSTTHSFSFVVLVVLGRTTSLWSILCLGLPSSSQTPRTVSLYSFFVVINSSYKSLSKFRYFHG